MRDWLGAAGQRISDRNHGGAVNLLVLAAVAEIGDAWLWQGVRRNRVNWAGLGIVRLGSMGSSYIAARTPISVGSWPPTVMCCRQFARLGHDWTGSGPTGGMSSVPLAAWPG